MKLSILTDEVSQDLGDVLRFAKELQIEGIELRSLNGQIEYLLREALRKAGRLPAANAAAAARRRQRSDE